jgi:hypothetical protein
MPIIQTHYIHGAPHVTYIAKDIHEYEKLKWQEFKEGAYAASILIVIALIFTWATCR